MVVTRSLGLKGSLRQIDDPIAWETNKPCENVTITLDVDQLGRDRASQALTRTRWRGVGQHDVVPRLLHDGRLHSRRLARNLVIEIWRLIEDSQGASQHCQT